MKLKVLVTMIVMCVAALANANVHGEFFAGSAAGEPSVDRAVLSLSQKLDAGWHLTVAGDGAGKNPSLFEASLGGAVLGGDLSVGFQQDVYAALMESKLQTRYLANPFSDLVAADRQIQASYAGSFKGVDYAAQVSDEVAGDHLQGYALLLSKALTSNVTLAAGSRYSGATKSWTSNAALVATKGSLVGALEVAQVAKGSVKVTTYGLTATAANVYKSVGLYAQALNTKEVGSSNSLLAGLTLPVNKSVNAAALLSHVDNKDDSVMLKLAASF